MKYIRGMFVCFAVWLFVCLAVCLAVGRWGYLAIWLFGCLASWVIIGHLADWLFGCLAGWLFLKHQNSLKHQKILTSFMIICGYRAVANHVAHLFDLWPFDCCGAITL